MPKIDWNWPIRTLCGLAVISLTAVLFSFFMFARAPVGTPHSSCELNLKQIGLGMLQYEQDYADHLPPVRSQGKVYGWSAYGWAALLQPYIKSTQLYQCPSQGNPGQSDPQKSGYTDYVFNARIEKQRLDDIPDLAKQILLLDGNWKGDVTDARYAFSQIPGAWFTDTVSPLYRHDGVANYLFADGHVRQYKPSEIGGANQPLF